MFVVLIHYKVPIEKIDMHLIEHRQFLEQCYKNNYFIVAGPRVPRTGGLIISQLNDETKLREIINQDPFVKNDLVSYDLIEFKPVKYHPEFNFFMN